MSAFASEETTAIADAVRRFCGQTLGESIHDSAVAPLSRPLWQALGDMGVLALQPGPGSGENVMLAAALLALGASAFPGPLPATFLARALLGEDAGGAIAQGARIVSMGPGTAMPWAELADIFIAIEGDEAVLVEGSAIAPVETLGGEQWARMALTARKPLGAWAPLAVHYDLPLAAYLIGAAGRLLDETAAYAAERRQFGRAIGDFQGVALPLAAASTRVDAARNLFEVAAMRLDDASSDAAALTTAARRLAGLAAQETAYVAHQTFGAFGTIRNGPVFALSRRFQQWTQQVPVAPTPDALVALTSDTSLLLLTPPMDDRCR